MSGMAGDIEERWADDPGPPSEWLGLGVWPGEWRLVLVDGDCNLGLWSWGFGVWKIVKDHQILISLKDIVK